MSEQWKERIRPIRLERRYEFLDYQNLRDFLDCVAEVSEREGLYPDMGFGNNYVNVTIHAAEHSNELGAQQRRLAKQYDALFKAEARD